MITLLLVALSLYTLISVLGYAILAGGVYIGMTYAKTPFQAWAIYLITLAIIAGMIIGLTVWLNTW